MTPRKSPSRPGCLPDLSRLTRREETIVRYAAQGYSTEGIARQLNIHSKTVRRHFYNIYAKCKLSGADSTVSPRAMLLRAAFERGWQLSREGRNPA